MMPKAMSSFCSSHAAEGGRGEGEREAGVVAMAPLLIRRVTGGCLRRTKARLHKGGGIIAPTALSRTSMGEDDLDRRRGAANATFPLAEERGGAVPGSH